MLAPRELPESFQQWNAQWHAPGGRDMWVPRRFKRSMPALRYRGPFAWQPNSSTRAFEYPWAHQQIARHGRGLTIAEIGGGLSGLQFVLAREGHRVVNIDPGMAAKGKGWRLDPAFHRDLCQAFAAPVELASTTIDAAGLGDESVDVLLSVSVLEHFTDEEVDMFVAHAPRLLKSGGVMILTIDLFLDVEPFCRRERNKWGRNLDVRSLLERTGLELDTGNRAELAGFAEFKTDSVMQRLSEFLVNSTYPVLTQCVVARKPYRTSNAPTS